MNNLVLKNKNCFITGATGGLGKEIAKALAEYGCNLFLTSNDNINTQQFLNEIKEINSTIKIIFEKGDLTNDEFLGNIIQKSKELGEIDILVNSAGIFPLKSISDSSMKDFDKCFQINVRVPFRLIKEFSKNMMKKKWGRIINIGSSSAYIGVKDSSIYCSTKHALLGLSRSMFNELKEFNIRTFCISPGSMRTEMGKMSGEITNQNYDTFIDPKEVADYISTIISYDNEMISEEIRINRIKIE
jgi:3-oxoacyl-[acyl-carrier protein] reductase